jgi:hypothetical protein
MLHGVSLVNYFLGLLISILGKPLNLRFRIESSSLAIACCDICF